MFLNFPIYIFEISEMIGVSYPILKNSLIALLISLLRIYHWSTFLGMTQSEIIIVEALKWSAIILALFSMYLSLPTISLTLEITSEKISVSYTDLLRFKVLVILSNHIQVSTFCDGKLWRVPSSSLLNSMKTLFQISIQLFSSFFTFESIGGSHSQTQ